jgi:ATP-dependent Clp protease ATP-binding subunit ClpC
VRDRFADQARRVLDLAREEAHGIGQRYLGPEHVVLGVLRDGTSAGAAVLRAHGLELEGPRRSCAVWLSAG